MSKLRKILLQLDYALSEYNELISSPSSVNNFSEKMFLLNKRIKHWQEKRDNLLDNLIKKYE